MRAVTFALPNESGDFLRLLGERRAPMAVLHTGVGRKVCQERIEPFLDSQPFEFLISSGFAGGVDPSLGVGDLLLAENFSDPGLLARAEAALLSLVGRDAVESGRRPTGIHLARLATAAHVIAGAAERARLAREQNAAAVDMETEWIAQACAARKVPMLSLRVISDTAAAPFPAPPAVLFDLEQQRTDPWRLTRHLLTHPSAVVKVTGFARQIALARNSLTAALTTLLRSLD